MSDPSLLRARSDIKDDTKALLREILMELKGVAGVLKRRTGEEAGKIESAKGDGSKEKGPGEGSTTVPLPVPAPDRATVHTNQRAKRSEIKFTYLNDLVGEEDILLGTSRNSKQAFTHSEEESFWKEVGDLWTLPFDGLVLFCFQRRHLLVEGAKEALIYLKEFSSIQNRTHLLIKDAFDGGSRKFWSFPGSPNGENYFKGFLSKSWSTEEITQNEYSTKDYGQWRRYVGFLGFEHASVKILEKHNIPFVSSDFELQDELINDYLRRRQKPSREGGWSGKLRFHVNFYDLLSITEEEVANYQTEYWKVGAVHSEPSKHRSLPHRTCSRRYLSQCAWSIFAFFAAETLFFEDYCPARRYWTIVEFQPSGHGQVQNHSPSGFPLEEFDVLLALMHRIKIVKYFDESLIDKCAFLDASAHDRLLTDDESFTRSKKYFWALSTLKELKNSVDANIQEIERLLFLQSPAELHGEQVWQIMVGEGHWNPIDDGGAKRVKRSFDNCRAKLRSVQDELRAISASFRDKFEEVTALRSGLFNASGVIETRNSTRLGQNVMLLTYVSILFLPISFSMSVWSVNDTFPIQRLWITAPILAVSTYILVFNLNNLTTSFLQNYHKVIDQTVTKMKTDENETWAKRGLEFEKLSDTRKAAGRMSDWRIVEYILLRLLSSGLASIRNFRIIPLTTKLKSWFKYPSAKKRENTVQKDLEAGAEQAATAPAAPNQSQPASTLPADTGPIEPEDNAVSAGTERSSSDALPGHQHDFPNFSTAGVDSGENASQTLNQEFVSSETECGLEETITTPPLPQVHYWADGSVSASV